MNIDFISLGVSIVLIIAFIAPIYLHIRHRNLQMSRSLAEIEKFIQKHGLNLTRKEHWRDRYYIGLDSKNGKLLYTSDMLTTPPSLLDLRQVGRIILEEHFHYVQIRKEKTKVLDSIHLQLLGKEGQELHRLECYDGNKFSDLSGEAMLAKQWIKVIEEALGAESPTKSPSLSKL
jgi:hypothetical protein